MGFRGHVASMGLEEVLNFLSQNALEGVLTVQSGDEATLRLYFQEGRVFFPFSARRGTYSLGKILRHTGVLSREALETYMSEARKKKAALLQSATDSTKVEEAQRLQSTEEIHDLFLWGNAHFEFMPGAMPPRVQQDMSAGRGLILDVQGLLMEVAHRQDERRRIRAAIPSSRVILRTVPGSERKIVEALQEARIDLSKSPFDGALRVDDLLVRWGVPHHDALRIAGLLVEQGHVALLPVEQARRFAQACLGAGDVSGAARFLGHALELDPGPRGLGGPEHELVVARGFRDGPEATASMRLPGPRVFLLAQDLILQGIPFTLVARVSGQKLELSALPGEVSIQGGPVRMDDVLLQLGLVTAAQVEESRQPSIPGFDPPRPLVELLTPEQRETAALELLVQSLGEAALWPTVEVELKNRRRAFPSSSSFTSRLSDHVRGRVVKAMAVMGAVLARVPGEDAIFVPGPRAKSGDPAARFFQRFALERTVGELRRSAQVARLEFLRFVSRGIDKGYVRAASLDELRAAFDAAREATNDVHAGRLARAAAALGYGDDLLRAAGQGVGASGSPVDGPALQGDLEGIGLAAVLQTLRNDRRTGTLVVAAARREEKLYFHRGDVFILRFEDAEGAAFAQFFLGDEGAEHVSDLLGNVEEASAGGVVKESQLSQDEVREIKAGFLDILFWEGATFAFFQNDLPEEFFHPGKDVTEIALETDRFLLDAIRALTEWDAIRRVVPTGRAVFRFAALDKKLAAIREHGHAEILTLIDGRQTFDDLVRISGERRLVVGRLVRALVESGDLEAMGASAAPAPKATTRRAPDLDADAPPVTMGSVTPVIANPAPDLAPSPPPTPEGAPAAPAAPVAPVVEETLDDVFDALSGGDA